MGKRLSHSDVGYRQTTVTFTYLSRIVTNLQTICRFLPIFITLIRPSTSAHSFTRASDGGCLPQIGPLYCQIHTSSDDCLLTAVALANVPITVTFTDFIKRLSRSYIDPLIIVTTTHVRLSLSHICLYYFVNAKLIYLSDAYCVNIFGCLFLFYFLDC